MSVQKIIAEADKFLERGKIPEAVEKLKFALQAEPMNQLATTKLANTYAAAGSKEKAAATFTALANRLSEAGKAQVAIAVYKQALELTPGDIPLKLRYAQECEGVGKVGDAQNQAQSVFQFYLRRKKYLDSTAVLPMLVRLNGKDERLKQAWIEVMQLSQAEKKLVPLLVALCGPPGLVSEEFLVGGEPSALSESLYEGLKKLVDFFPRDPKIAYALAWCAYRRDKRKDFFHYLRECLRREPDFCLGMLLFARVLAEREKLNEAYFVFKYMKERVGADKSADDVSTLNQLIEAFVEKNGWISFTEQSEEQLLPAQFVESLRGAQSPLPEPPGVTGTATANIPEPIPSQISITMPFIKPPTQEVAAEANQSPLPTAAATFESQPEPGPAPAEIELGAGNINLEIQHHSEKGFSKKAAAAPAPKSTKVEKPPLVREAEEVTGGTMVMRSSPPESLADEAPPPARAIAGKRTFNPLADAAIPEGANNAELNQRDDKTEMFSPMELIGAANQAISGYDQVKTKVLEPEPSPENLLEPHSELGESTRSSASIAQATSSTLPSRTVGIQSPAGEWHALKLDGAPTDMFSPIDILQAHSDSRPHSGSNVETRVIATARPAASEPSSPNVDEATSILNAAAAEVDEEYAEGFSPIPANESEYERASANAEPGIDMGDDLLDGATRILLAPSAGSATQNLLKEIQRDISKKEGPTSDPAMMLRKAERFIAKRNYYLARKALRHAQALGASEEIVRSRLGDIRKLELPESLYQSVSSDGGIRERSSDILERLEREFEIAEDEETHPELEGSIEEKLESIFQDNDARTILDFGVGLHEMGLYRQAEQVFTRIVEAFPDFSFDAYYLAAVSKYSQKDYAGAVSILKKLSIDVDKTDHEKIQIYYALGELFEKMSQSDRSKEFFRKVAELDSNYRNIRHKLEE